MIYKTKMEMALQDLRLPAEDHHELTLHKIDNPTYRDYKTLHDRVGAPYGWHERARINDVGAIQALLSNPLVELWQFSESSNVVGYALFTCAHDKTAELEDFGFFPEFCGKGYGNFYIARVLGRLKELGIKHVWLTTRSTNHPKVVSFYQKSGFRVIEEIPIS